MTSRFITFILALCAICFPMAAQEIATSENADSLGAYENAGVVARINHSGTISVSVPAGLEEMLCPPDAAEADAPATSEAAAATKSQKKVGYRVQVFDDNNVHTAKQEAEKRGMLIRSRFPEMEITTEFHSPYWRVKAGNFRTRSEAENALAAIRAAFPSIGSQLRVVRDRINLQN